MTDGQTDGGDYNIIPFAFLKKRGDKNSLPKTHLHFQGTKSKSML